MTLKTLPVIQPTPPLQPPSPPPPQQQPQSLLSWVFIDTRKRFLLFMICSPVLLPLLCLSFPLICLAHLYNCLRQRRRLREKRRRDDVLRRCEEGRGEGVEDDREIGWMLMQRYLEDQLGLVGSVVAVYDCGQEEDEDGDEDGDDYYDNDVNQGAILDETRRPLLV